MKRVAVETKYDRNTIVVRDPFYKGMPGFEKTDLCLEVSHKKCGVNAGGHTVRLVSYRGVKRLHAALGEWLREREASE